MTESQRAAILDELLAEMHISEPRQQNDASLAELAARAGRSETTIRRHLKPLLEANIWATAMRYDPAIGHEVRVFWKVGGAA